MSHAIKVAMPRRINAIKRRVADVGESVQALWVGRIGYNGVGTEPAAKLRVILPGAHLDQLNVTVEALARVADVGGQGARHIARLAIGHVLHLASLVPVRVEGETGTAQMIAVQEV